MASLPIVKFYIPLLTKQKYICSSSSSKYWASICVSRNKPLLSILAPGGGSRHDSRWRVKFPQEERGPPSNIINAYLLTHNKRMESSHLRMPERKKSIPKCEGRTKLFNRLECISEHYLFFLVDASKHNALTCHTCRDCLF